MSLYKIGKFGESFVSVIKEYVSKNPQPKKSIRRQLMEHPLPPSAQPTGPTSVTQLISVELFNQGMSPEQIAEER